MTLKAWGQANVSSALDVYNLLTSPDRAIWEHLISLEPPFWGQWLDHAFNVTSLIARDYRVWSWDDHGVVLSANSHIPPHGIHYRRWDHFFHEREDEPTHPRALVGVAAENPHADCNKTPRPAD